jgi:hypothetical protein
MLERMLLLLAPSSEQQKSLDTLLAAQQTPGNASFHHWLTAAEYADRFAVSAGDAAAVTAWLQSQGFSVATLPAGRGWVEFSGTVDQVQRAFGAQVKAASSNADGTRYQLAGTIQLPAAISALAKGLVSLDGELSIPAATVPAELTGTPEALIAQTSISKASALTPSLAQSWLHLSSTVSAGTTGTGESIAIPTRSNVRPEDFTQFRKSFGLPESALQVNLAAAGANVDPGRNSDEAATILAASWAGVAAPQAQILLVPAASTNATDGIDLALAAVIDGALAHTVSLGYSACESSISATHQAFYAALFRQAAAEGIAILAATGDSGAAACHLPADTNPVSSGFSVNALASTPWTTAIGAVAFDADATTLTGWQPSSATDRVYATPAYATGGGASSVYDTPSWQSSAGIPASDPATASSSVATHHRYLPDVSLPTAANVGASQGLGFCFAGDSASSGCRLMKAGGSAASAAIFSGVAALLAQKYGPQGNLAPNLYALSHLEQSSKTKQADAAFLDITAGAAKLSCEAGSSGCVVSAQGSSEIGFDAVSGFDLATGLGSVNAQNLIENWLKADTTLAATTTTVTALPTTLTEGTPETLTAVMAPSTTTTDYSITGTVSFYDGTTLLGTETVSDNEAVLSVTLSATVDHSITAVYSGDSTYATSTSSALVLDATLLTATVTLTAGTTTLAPDQTTTLTATVTPTATPLSTAEQYPTGYVDFYSGSTLIGASELVYTSGYSSAATLTGPLLSAGTYDVTAVYLGDSTYATATSNTVDLSVENFTIASSTTNLTLEQGATGTATFTVTSLGGLTGNIQVVCVEQNPPTVGAITCTFNPSVVDGTGTTTLTVVTTSATSSARRPELWPAAGGGALLAFAGLLLSPIGRRARWLRGNSVKLLGLALLALGLAGTGLGCNSSVNLTSSTGTPLGVHTLKITAAEDVNTVTVSHYAYLTVNVTQ